MNAVIDQFVVKRRQWELENIEPLPPTAKRPQFQDQKVRVINVPFEDRHPIKICLHHSSVFSEGDFFHYHDFFELIYLYRGGCLQRFAQNELSMKEHDILLLNPNTVHAPYTTCESDCMFNILISKGLFEQSMLSLMTDKQMLSSFILDCLYQISRAQDYLYFPADESGQVSSIMESMILESIRQDLNYEKAMEAWLVLLFTQLSRVYKERCDPSLLSGLENNRTVADVLAYMNKNAPTVSLEDLSIRFGYSVGHLSRLIRQHTGKTYAEIVQRLKLERARCLLEACDDPIAEVMDRAGFHSAHHFYRIFKEHYLMSPAEYRKNVRIPKSQDALQNQTQ